MSNALARYSLHDHLGEQGHQLPHLSHEADPLRGKFEYVRAIHVTLLLGLQLDKEDSSVSTHFHPLRAMTQMAPPSAN